MKAVRRVPGNYVQITVGPRPRLVRTLSRTCSDLNWDRMREEVAVSL